MKKVLLLAVLPMLITVCTKEGKKEEEKKLPELTIKVSSETLNIDKAESVNFSVFLDGEDVTEYSEIIEVTNNNLIFLKSTNDYSTLKPGNHIFKALYDSPDGKVNYGSVNSVTVNAFSETGISGTFYRRSFALKFTGTWCHSCPSMSTALDKASKDNPDRISKVAIHSGDQLENVFGNEIMKRYSVPALPTLRINGFNNTYDLANRSALEIKKKMDETIIQNPTVVGIKLTTSVNSDNLLTVDVEVNAAKEGEYKLGCYITQSGFNYEQSGTNDPNYHQDNVLIAALQDELTDSMEEAVFGKSIGGDNGIMVVNERVGVQYTLQLPDTVKDLSSLEIVAFVMNDIENDGIFEVNNSRTASLNETQMYEYEVIEEKGEE